VFPQNLKKGEIMDGVQIKAKMNEMIAFGCNRKCVVVGDDGMGLTYARLCGSVTLHSNNVKGEGSRVLLYRADQG
jgi:hypothetical protein